MRLTVVGYGAFAEANLRPPTRKPDYLDSNRRVLAERVCYARPTCSLWSLKQGAMVDFPLTNEDLEHKITLWQHELDVTLMKSVCIDPQRK